ncbi:MAG: sigma-70 family RNA polymerase sigma factor [Deltaproteobacteria bacterium]
MAVITDRPPAGHGLDRVSRGSVMHDDQRLQELPPERAPAPPDFDDVYDQHFAFAWRNLRRLGVHEPQLSDAAQDVFLVVHRRLPQFSGESAPLRSWVYSIVVRVARQYRRGLRRKPTSSLDDVGSVPDASGMEPERSAQQSEALRQLLGLLDRLDENKREAFVLAELEGLTAPEIAEILGMNVNTIYARIRAARRALEAIVAALPAQARG